MKLIQILKLFTFVVITSLVFFSCQPNQSDESNKETLNMEKDINELMEQMTVEEKVGMIHASSSFTSGGVERLGIPELIMSDGPHGVRHEHGRDWAKDEGVEDSGTYLPVGVALAATWNPELGYKFGSVLGTEANYRGKDIILGPGVNIIRSPINGRNFEYLTEDPYLNSRMAVGYIKGVQEQGVAACIKHYIANTLEFEREKVNVEMSERALREIYLPAYKAAVQEADVNTIMAAYNKFRGTFCAHNTYLLDDVLRGELGFKGMVISDWAAVKNTLEAVSTSLDLEMGSELRMPNDRKGYNYFYMADPLLELIKKGEVDEALVDKKVERILNVMEKINAFGGRQEGAYNTKGHQETALTVAKEAIVLLKNDNVLPLKKEQLKKVAVVGANANHKHAGAGGSSQVKALYEVTPLEGLKKVLQSEVNVEYSPGYEITKEHSVKQELIEEAVANVKDADIAIYVGGLFHGYTDEWNDNAYDAEEVDRPDMLLPFGQDELINAVLEANPNTIIVLQGGGPVDMSAWKDKAKGIIFAWYAGMEGGNALAEIIFGEISPSGKLPMTFPEKLEDSPAHSVAQYPDENLLIDHKDDIFVGYRYFDTYKVEPAFPFGFGLSYTSFDFKELTIQKEGEEVTVNLTITNTGQMEGAEVVQLYVKDEQSALTRPEKELKAFQKVNLAPGGTTQVAFKLKQDAFSYYDDQQGKWVLEPGKFVIAVGNSSRNILLEEEVEL